MKFDQFLEYNTRKILTLHLQIALKPIAAIVKLYFKGTNDFLRKFQNLPKRSIKIFVALDVVHLYLYIPNEEFTFL